MTKSKKNPFSFGNSNFGNSGFKLPKAIDPFKEVRKSARSFDKQFNNIKMPNVSMPKVKDPFIQKSRQDRSFDIKIPQISMPKSKPISTTIIRKPDSIFSNIVNRSTFPQNRETRFISKNNITIPTLADVVKDYKRKFDESREKARRAWEAEKQAQRELQLRMVREPRVIIQPVPVSNHLENSISQIHEKLSQKDKEVTDLQNKVKKVTDDMTELKERVKILENYDHELIEQITSLLKIKNEQGENMPTDAMALLTELLKEKQKTEVDIESIKTKLNEIDEQQKKVVEQQEKDVPFNQSLRKLLDDAKDDSQVL